MGFSLPTDRLVRTFLEGRSEHTRRAYRMDLQCFQAFLGADSVEQAVEELLVGDHGGANTIGHEYRAHLVERGLSPATVNRRLSALRSLFRRARALGVVPWTLDVPNVQVEPYRDTRGPGRDGFNRMLRALGRRGDRAALRDQAALRLLFDLALRREEVVSLDVADIDLELQTVAVKGKGRTQRIRLTLPPPTITALKRWLAIRGEEPGPLFVNFDPAKKGDRLTGRSLHRIVKELGRVTQTVGADVAQTRLRAEIAHDAV